MRCAGLLIALLMASCALLKGPPPKGKAQVIESEESGVNHIAKTLKDFRSALADKEFRLATRLMVRAEKAIKKASVLTRSHPDFEDIAEMVRRSREKLDVAIEEDRIARREAAIDDLIQRGDLALRQGTALVDELKVRVPSAEDVQALAEIISTLVELRADGRPFMGEARYEGHARDRDRRATVLEERLASARWQLAANQAVNAHVEEAYRAASSVKEAESSPERIVRFQRAAEGFASCASTIDNLSTEPEFKDGWLIESRFGTFTLAKTKRLCGERSTRARKESYKLDWHNKLLDIIENLKDPVSRSRKATRATHALDATREALEALSDCQTTLDKIARHPGLEARRTFETVLGKLSAARLRQACAAEHTRLSKSLPRLEWRKALEALAARVDEAKREIDQAELTTHDESRVKKWQSAIGGLKECIEEARRVAGERGADRSFAVSTEFGKLTVQNIERECKRQLEPAQESLEKATAALELNRFITTCKGDEVAVARREGMPTRIQDVEGGRIFIYETRAKGRKPMIHSYGFDSRGKRVDFRLRWLNEVGAVVSDINQAMQAIARAPNGSEALRATEAALPVLSRCVDELNASDKRPGYDATAVFTTSLGKVPAGRLAQLCSAERVRRSQSMVGLRWQIRLEALRDRVDEAQAAFEQGKAARDPAKKAERLSTAVVSYTECTERNEALATAEGANKSLKVKTAFGDLTLRGLARACQNQLKLAQKDLERATADKALDDFIKTCRGDEIEVVRRRGIPTRVEKRTGGRIFVYEPAGRKKSKAKRFAFDEQGKRIDEKILDAPKLEVIP